MARFKVPLVIRGRIIEEDDIEFGSRHGGARYSTPDVSRYLDALPLRQPSAIADLYALNFDDIIAFLDRLAPRLTLHNPHLKLAYELSVESSGLSADILRATYDNLGSFFEASYARQHADILIGIPFLDGWVDIRKDHGYLASVRAFGARAVHIVAGNSPAVCAISLMRNFITRSDAIVKTPSNDPLTAFAIARTMIDMAPDHPITRHLSVAYWKGGDESIESVLYQPRNIEKLVAWGGLASVQHVLKYVQPGIDLITLDPKISVSIIGAEAFSSPSVMADAAFRAAVDVGAYNQETCVNARVIYVQTGSDQAGLIKAEQLGKLIFDEMQRLPNWLSTPARAIGGALAEELEGLKFAAGNVRVIGGDVRGGVVISENAEPVEFSHLLANRVVNLVPVESLEEAIEAANAYTQTIGIYPDSLMPLLRDQLAFHGAQRFVTLGYATRRVVAGPSDGIEPARRMCKWILQEKYDSDIQPVLSPL